MVYVSHLLGLQVDDVDVRFRHVHHDHLPIIQHAEEIDDVCVLMLKENTAVLVNMHDAFVSAGVYHLREDKSVVKGS